MLNSLSKNIADFLLCQNCFEKELISVYVYGIELFLSSVLGVLLVLLASLFTGNILQGVVFLFAFISLRLFTGGLHCNSYIACNTVTVMSFLLAAAMKELISRTTCSNGVYCVFILISLTVTAVLAPVSNPNKIISSMQKRKYQLISLCILVIHFMLYICFNRFLSTEIIVITDFISSVYIIIGLLKNKTERRISDENQKEHS